MNNSITMQDLRDLEAIRLNEIREINTAHRKEVKEKDIVIDALKFEIANLRDRLESTDRQWNKTIDAHEVTKQRLLGYENEAGVPMSASERKIYLQGGEDYKLNMVKDYMNEYFSVERWANDNGMTFDEGFKLLSEHATQDEFSNWTLNK